MTSDILADVGQRSSSFGMRMSAERARRSAVRSVVALTGALVRTWRLHLEKVLQPSLDYIHIGPREGR
jgi:hypothetical protein